MTLTIMTLMIESARTAVMLLLTAVIVRLWIATMASLIWLKKIPLITRQGKTLKFAINAVARVFNGGAPLVVLI